MGNLKKPLQVITAILRQELLDMFTMFGGLPMFQERGKAAITDGAIVYKPGAFKELRLVKLIPPAGELQHRGILIHQDVFCHCHACCPLSKE